MRLDKFIADNTQFSRSEAKTLIKSGRLTINGEPAKLATQKVQTADQVALDGEPVTPQREHYLMVNKPEGYVCATSDSDHPTVLDLPALIELIPPEVRHRIQIAGRLDMDTTGLVLLTTDGAWNHRITSPNYLSPKGYLVECAEEISASTIDLFREGLLLRSENRKTLPAELQILDAQRAKLYLRQGLYHQVKRMFASTGNRVVRLHRFSVGDIHLDPSLGLGDARTLSSAEVESI